MKQNQTVVSGIRCLLLSLLLLLLAAILQSSLSMRMSLFGLRLELLPLLTAAAGVVLGPRIGLACGLFTGLLLNALGCSGIEGILPLYYVICGIAAGAAGERFRVYEMRTTAICVSVILAVRVLLRSSFVLLLGGSMTAGALFGTLASLVLPAAVLSPIAVVVMRLVRGKKRQNAQPMESASDTLA